MSYSGSLLYPLSVIVERQLQIVASQQPAYIANSSNLKDLLLLQPFPPNAMLFTGDANSMYTNIPTDAAIEIIQRFLNRHEDDTKLPSKTTIEALQFLIDNNIFRFGDSFY